VRAYGRVQEGDEEKLIMEWCAPTMLRLVPLPNIIMLMRALLQEYKIVLLCKNLGVLSFIAYVGPTLPFLSTQAVADVTPCPAGVSSMALLPLLRPFEWQGPFIPLVPKNLEECVESPGIAFPVCAVCALGVW
jgi:hypothetical protein